MWVPHLFAGIWKCHWRSCIKGVTSPEENAMCVQQISVQWNRQGKLQICGLCRVVNDQEVSGNLHIFLSKSNRQDSQQQWPCIQQLIMPESAWRKHQQFHWQEERIWEGSEHCVVRHHTMTKLCDGHHQQQSSSKEWYCGNCDIPEYWQCPP